MCEVFAGQPKENYEPITRNLRLNGQTHDVNNLFVSDGSQMTTGAAENQTLTIVALAIRQADRIASEMSKGNV